MRSDDGTENCHRAHSDASIRSQRDDEYSGDESFKVGRSTENQRIEAFWSQLIKDRVGWWRKFFKDLSNQGHFDDTDPVQQDCIRLFHGSHTKRFDPIYRILELSHDII